MNFRTNDGDRDKYDESLHYQPPKKFDSSLHYIAPAMTPILPEDREKYNIKKHLECKSLYFDGVNDYIYIPDSVSLSTINTMTAIIWVKETLQNYRGILSHWDNNSERGFLTTSYENNKFRVLISDNGSWDVGHRISYISSIIVAENAYHQIGFTFNAGTVKLFVDGIEDPNPTKTYDDAIATIHDSTANVVVGCYLDSDTPVAFFNGSIADTRIYNRALSSTEILRLYNNQSINETGLVLDLPMTSDYSGKRIIHDESGNGNDGTLQCCKWNCDWIREKQKVI